MRRKHYLIPSNTNPSSKSITITLFCNDGVVNLKWALSLENLAHAKKATGNRFSVNRNGVYFIQFETSSGETVKDKFCIRFLNTSPIFAGGQGTEQEPYLIENVEQLNAVRTALGAHFRLISDVDLAADKWGLSWVPIGEYVEEIGEYGHTGRHLSEYMFYGVFDGNGHTISNLYIHGKGTKGLFLHLDAGTVKDLTLRDIYIGYIPGHYSLSGGIAGAVSGGHILSCSVQGEIDTNYWAGGIVGSLTGGWGDQLKWVVEQCSFSGVIRGWPDEEMIGEGLVDRTNLASNDMSEVGGIAGHCNGIRQGIRNCWVNAELVGKSAAGITCYPELEAIETCFSRGHCASRYTIDCSTLCGIGGAIVVGELRNSWNERTWAVRGCVCAMEGLFYLEGHNKPISSYSGGYNACGRIDACNVPDGNDPGAAGVNNYALDELGIWAGKELIPAIEGSMRDGCGKSRKALIMQRTYEELGWDFQKIWEMGKDGFPVLKRDVRQGGG